MPFADLAPVLARAERWLLPGACLLCGEAVASEPDDPLICGLCCSRFHRLPEPQCTRCGQPLLDRDQPCRVCAAWPDGFERVRSAVWLEEGSRRAVHHLKYSGWWRVASPMARVMSGLMRPGPAVLLVPIPLAAARARRRGYNQAERLAVALGQQGRCQLATGVLRRGRDTRTQTRLAPEARQANIAGAFVAESCSGARVVLVDDVFTTGATLVEAATVLLQAGAAEVEAVTFARAKPPLG